MPYHVHVKKQRLLAGVLATLDDNDRHSVLQGEQNEPLNLSVDKHNEKEEDVLQKRWNTCKYEEYTPVKNVCNESIGVSVIKNVRESPESSVQPTKKNVSVPVTKKKVCKCPVSKKSVCKCCVKTQLTEDTHQLTTTVCKCFTNVPKTKKETKKNVCKCVSNVKKTKSKSASKKNKKTHKMGSKMSHECGNCEYQTYEIEAFEEHLRLHANEVPFRCTFCLFSTPWKTEFNFHMDKHYALYV